MCAESVADNERSEVEERVTGSPVSAGNIRYDVTE